MSILGYPLGWIMWAIYKVVNNYGVALILFTVLVRLALFPLSVKQQKSSAKMQVFQPKMQEIQKKYANNKEKQQEESSQKKAEQRDAFSKKMDELESDDLKISSAENQEDELAMTASSFEQWDNLLSEMYDYLATVLNADQYASEEASYKQWVQERDSGAENAAKETEDDTAKQLASYSFKQSYTKTHCYKLLDLMN